MPEVKETRISRKHYIFILYARYPIVARALGLAAFRPSARKSKSILHTNIHNIYVVFKILGISLILNLKSYLVIKLLTKTDCGRNSKDYCASSRFGGKIWSPRPCRAFFNFNYKFCFI